jgi:hypothetical protein
LQRKILRELSNLLGKKLRWVATLWKKSEEKAMMWGVKPSWERAKGEVGTTLCKKSVEKGVKPSWERAEVSCHVVKKTLKGSLWRKELRMRSQTFLRKSWEWATPLWKKSVQKATTWDVKPSWERAKSEESNLLEEELGVSCPAVEKKL